MSPSDDTTPPPTPTGLEVVSGSPAGVELAWDEVTGDPTLHGYQVLRSDTSGGPYETIALVTSPAYTDTDVVEGATYFYVVRAVDTSFNRSGNSNEVQATARLRSVEITFRVTVPDHTPADATVHIAGTLHLLDGGLPEWDPGATPLTHVSGNVWEITVTGTEGTSLEYKYTLGSWDLVEKGSSCEELANRPVTLAYGTDGTQLAEDTVANWRNVPPCGD